MENLKPGDRVEWNTPQGRTVGVVRKVVTRDTRVRGTQLRGSEDDPVYIVRTRATGMEAGYREHKDVALKRRP